MNNTEHVFNPEIVAPYFQADCLDKLGGDYSDDNLGTYQFKDRSNAKQVIDSRSLFYQLNQTENVQKIFPLAYNFIIESLMDSERVYSSSMIEDYSEEQLLLLKSPTITPLPDQLLTQNNLNKCVNQSAPILLTETCWLQNISQVPFCQTMPAVQLMSIYLQLTQKKQGNFDLLGAYRSLILSTGVNIPILHSYSFSHKPEILPDMFGFASIQLALARFPRIFLPEIIGFTLAYCQIPTLIEVCFPNHQLPSIFFNFRQQCVKKQEQPLFDCIKGYLDLFAEHKQVLWQRIQNGFWLYQLQIRRCRDQFKMVLEKPVSSQLAISRLFQQKAKAAIGHHQNIKLSGKTLDSWFAGMPANSQDFLHALKQSIYVNQHKPDESLLLKLFEFKGPMFGILTESDQTVLRDWLKNGLNINSNESLSGKIRESEIGPFPLPRLNSERNEDLIICEGLMQGYSSSSTNTWLDVDRAIQEQQRSGVSRRNYRHIASNETGATTQKTDTKIRKTLEFLCFSTSQDSPIIETSLLRHYAKLNNRELYYYLLNADMFPNVLPNGKDKIDKLLGFCSFINHPPFKHYTHKRFDTYIESIYKREMNAYQPMQGKPKISREAYVWGIEQIAPMILIDGCWLQNSPTLQNVCPEISEILFNIYCDEIGNGRLEENHPYIFQQLLDSLSIQLPPVHSTEFVKHRGFIKSAFDLPVYMLALSNFSVEFLPELLGLNMAIEISGLGKSYMNLIDEWNYWEIDPTIAKIHVSIDNYESGHTFLAKKAIQLYLDDVIKRSGDRTILNKHWRRIYNGYASLRFVGWRFKLDLPFCYLLHKFNRKKMLHRV